MLSIELKLFNCINMQENQQKWAKSIISTVIAMSTAIAISMAISHKNSNFSLK